MAGVKGKYTFRNKMSIFRFLKVFDAGRRVPDLSRADPASQVGGLGELDVSRALPVTRRWDVQSEGGDCPVQVTNSRDTFIPEIKT